MSTKSTGRTILVRAIRRLDQYEDWKRAVFLRDSFTCQWCGARNGRKRIIEADHIKSLAELISENQIASLGQAISCPELWEVSNGRTLCKTCHEKTDSYPVNFRSKKKKVKKQIVILSNIFTPCPQS